jgi:Zn-dependent M28 family amino/carboxypeptidase
MMSNTFELNVLPRQNKSRRAGDMTDKSRRAGDTTDKSRRAGDTTDKSRRAGDTTNKFVLLCALSVLAACSVGPTKTAFKAQANDQRYQADLKEISSDYFEGRGPGSAGEKRFVPWLEKQYKAIGLSPGNGDSYLQAVPMTEITNTMSTPLTFKTARAEHVLKFGEDYVLLSKLQQPEVKLEASELIFMGYGVKQANENWNDFEGVDVKGKTIVVLINDPGFHVNDLTLFNGKAMTYAGRWSYKFEEAARQGAAGCIIVHDTRGAAYGWEVLKNGAGRPDFELPVKANATAPLKVQGWITGEVASKLFSDAEIDFEQARMQANKRGFKAIPLKATASAGITQKIRSATSHNVVGLIRGTEKPEEVVIYSAHWDHLGRNFGLVGDQIFNGAIDNATGVAGILEIARLLKAAKPKRSVMFLAVTLEESGLLGSRHYAENPLMPLQKTLANLNIDALKILGPTSDIDVIGSGNSDLEDILKVHADAQDRVLKPEPTPENGFYFRSDHFNFAKLGVPALYIKSGNTHREKGEAFGIESAAKYTAERYHKPNDEFDSSWDYRGAMDDLNLLALVGLSVANGESMPKWYPNSEFRAVREQSLQQP